MKSTDNNGRYRGEADGAAFQASSPSNTEFIFSLSGDGDMGLRSETDGHR
jgi:hypothetical protein